MSIDRTDFDPPMPIVHFEIWVSNRKDRRRMRAATSGAYQSARRITQSSGGSGPWIFLVDQDPPDAKSPRLRKILGVQPKEDLWAEIVFYPNRRLMKTIIARIWKDGKFQANAKKLDRLVCRRVPEYQGVVAYLTRQKI